LHRGALRTFNPGISRGPPARKPDAWRAGKQKFFQEVWHLLPENGQASYKNGLSPKKPHDSKTRPTENQQTMKIRERNECGAERLPAVKEPRSLPA